MSKTKKPNQHQTQPSPPEQAEDSVKRSKKRKGRKKSKEAKQNTQLQKQVRKLRRELEAKNAVLELYGDPQNWVKPEQVRERLNIPEVDRSGQTIESPTQCFVGARYPWEPALKVMMGLPEEPTEKSDSAQTAS